MLLNLKKDSKGCADLIANAYYVTNPNKDTLIKLIEESNLLQSFKNQAEKYDSEIDKNCKKLEYIISKIPENLITVFRLDNDQSCRDIEFAILRAFLNCNKIIK